MRPAPPAAKTAVAGGSSSQVGGDFDETGEGDVEGCPLLATHTPGDSHLNAKPWDRERTVDVEMTLK